MPYQEQAESFNINLAFQGGGAKLAILIECAQQLKQLELDEKIKIHKLSGTSAGAIVAGLLASDADFNVVKVKLNSIFTKIEEQLKIKPKFRSKTWGALHCINKGKEFFDFKALTYALDEIFKTNKNKGILTFDNLSKDLSIVVTDLASRSKKTFSNEKTSSDNVVEAIAYSCTLPFIFHSHASDRYYVDGGLCENLPVEEFDNVDGVYNVAIGFDDEFAECFTSYHGVKDYLERIISSSINHGVKRSQNSKKCHEIIKLRPTVGTLDFKKAIKKLNDRDFESDCRLSIHELLISLNDRRTNEQFLKRKNDQQKTKLDKLREDLYESLTLLEHHKVSYKKKILTVLPYCLYEQSHEKSTYADKIQQIEIIEPNEPLRCYHFQLAADVDSIHRYIVNVKSGNDKIPWRVFEVERKSKIRTTPITTLFLFFDKELSPGHQYTITVTYSIYNAMIDLSNKGSDYLTVMNDRRIDSVYQEVLLVFFLPENLENKIEMSYREDKFDSKGGLKAVEGKFFSEEDHNTIQIPHDEGVSNFLGWKYKNFKYNDSISVKLSLKQN